MDKQQLIGRLCAAEDLQALRPTPSASNPAAMPTIDARTGAAELADKRLEYESLTKPVLQTQLVDRGVSQAAIQGLSKPQQSSLPATAAAFLCTTETDDLAPTPGGRAVYEQLNRLKLKVELKKRGIDAVLTKGMSKQSMVGYLCDLDAADVAGVANSAERTPTVDATSATPATAAVTPAATVSVCSSPAASDRRTEYQALNRLKLKVEMKKRGADAARTEDLSKQQMIEYLCAADSAEYTDTAGTPSTDTVIPHFQLFCICLYSSFNSSCWPRCCHCGAR
mmetsp:Transcript_9744/g.30068  ORF Transcript_9744/g.30068 Transcript_9744/m.30068 type:complete len:281 (-) Transcript_9744:3949-4791(-)